MQKEKKKPLIAKTQVGQFVFKMERRPKILCNSITSY